MPLSDNTIGWPALTGPPVAAMNVWPLAGISRWLVSCGELSAASPTFCATTASDSRFAGSVSVRSTAPDSAASGGRGKLLRLEVLAVHVRDGLHRRAGGHLVELRAAVRVGLHRLHPRADAQIHGVIRDVVREAAANQTNRDAAGRQIVHGTRD